MGVWAQAGAPVLASAVSLCAAPATMAQAAAEPAPLQSAMVEDPCALGPNPGDWGALCHYQRADREVAAPPRAVFIGDSITQYWLAAGPALFADGVVNRGITGQTSAQMLVRFTQDVVRLRPRVVHIMAGTNDVAGNKGPTSAAEYVNAISAMADIAHANGIAVVIASVLPAAAFPWRPGFRPAAQIEALNRWLRAFAKARGYVFADYHAAMADAEGGMKPGLAGDGVHPSPEGYAMMEPIALAALAQAEKAAGGEKRRR
ncbi:GDSL-type esterase/lipase family protein [Novosphingobium percolationis]|uniref:GDSL-type esterase/lipase family protein n=1 Tax=Novosphingobium percolationis TaxID=2871811 RepID=UPI001CD6BC95|nr:GDSL-type esterase/lipase family protein [Novosphingobium percolationis]